MGEEFEFDGKEKKKRKGKKKKKKKGKKNKSVSESEEDESESDSDDSSDDSTDESSDDSESEDSNSSNSQSSNSNSNSDSDSGTKTKSKDKKNAQNFENDLNLLLNGNIDEYISKNMPMDIPAMSDENMDAPLVNRDELRPHSLSIQIKDVEMLQQQIGIVNRDEDEDADDEDDAKEAAKSRNRKLDRIMRGSKSNLEYTKKVIQMVEADRNPSVKESKKNKKKKSEAESDNVHKQHLDEMIGHIMAGKEFIPFSNSEDKA